MQGLKCYGTCPICQELILGFKSKYEARHCNHIYHRICIDNWKTTSNACPVSSCQAVIDQRKVKRNQIVDSATIQHHVVANAKREKMFTKVWKYVKRRFICHFNKN